MFKTEYKRFFLNVFFSPSIREGAQRGVGVARYRGVARDASVAVRRQSGQGAYQDDQTEHLAAAGRQSNMINRLLFL